MIDRLYVQNFRCLESVTFEFAGQSSILIIGKNGVGKSSARQSLALLQQICRGTNATGRLLSVSDFSQQLVDRPMRFEVDLTLDGKRFQYVVAFEWPAGFEEPRILDENMAVDGQSIFARHHSDVTLASGSKFGLSWHVCALPVIEERQGSRTIQALKAYLAGMILVAPTPALMTGYAAEPSGSLEHDASNFAACLRALLGQKPAAYGAFDRYVKDVMPDFSSIENVDRGGSGTQLVVRFDSPDSTRSLSLEFDSLSDGEKCFFLSAYVIASNSVGPPVVCLWDEPDNHLALSEVGQLVMALRKMTGKGGQFIATTHHPETIRQFSDETTLVLTRKSHLDPTLLRPLSAFVYSGDLITALIRDEVIG